MITDEVLRAQLVLAVENSAKRRAKKADGRHISSSQSLAALAKKLEALPINNPHLAAYLEIMARVVAVAQGSALRDISKIETHCIGRYGVDYPRDGNGNPAPFLFVLTRAITELVEEEEERNKKRGRGR